jgi:acyl carrier protein
VNLQEQIIQIIAKELRLKPEVVVPTADLKEDLGVDSLDALETVVALEDAFKIVYPADTHKDIHTVQDVIDVTVRLIK